MSYREEAKPKKPNGNGINYDDIKRTENIIDITKLLKGKK
jgi:hypothetical protein